MAILKSLFVIAISLILSTNAFSQEKPKTLPDDPLYQAKREIETAELNAEFDPVKKAALYTKYAEERLAEIKMMVSKGKPEFVEDLVKDYEEAINGMLEEIKRAQTQGRNIDDALETVEMATKKHIEVLRDILGKVPEQAKSAIAHAIDVSQHGRNQAMQMLIKIQRDKIPIGKPEGISKPKGVGKPQGIGRPSSGRPTGRRGR
jgi:hypothetical protein